MFLQYFKNSLHEYFERDFVLYCSKDINHKHATILENNTDRRANIIVEKNGLLEIEVVKINRGLAKYCVIQNCG